MNSIKAEFWIFPSKGRLFLSPQNSGCPPCVWPIGYSTLEPFILGDKIHSVKSVRQRTT